MASLAGNFIKDTYQSLLKLIDNGNVTSTAKEITDGEGNGTGISIDTSGNVTATGIIQGSSITNGTTSISDLQTNKEDKSEKGAASGYAPLDSNSKVPADNLPDSVLGQVEYKGTWNADTNTPTLPSASGVKGNYYVVSIAGVYETVDYEIGDWVISNGTQWEKVDNSDKVSSVNGQTGVVVLNTDNVSEGATNQYYTTARANSDFDTRLATKDTDNLTEGSNLYYTDTRVSANADVTANTAKVGITTQQADDIIANNAKNSYPSADALKLSGIESGAEVNVNADWNAASGDALILNKPTTITTQQAADITANNAKISFDSTSSTKLAGIEEGAEVNTVDSVNSLTGTVSLGLLDLDDVGADGNSGEVLTTDGQGNFTFSPSGGGTGAVSSVNGATGAVVLDTDDIDEGTTNLYYTDARVSANTDVVANAANISTNASNIASNDTDISSLQTDVSTNTTNIATNVSDISTNSTSIATNATNIASNDTDISALQSDVSTNTSNISTNTSDISTNTSAIATNTGNISTNATNISSNDTDIATNASNISSNTSSISTNATNIATNVTNIASNTSNISTNTSNIATNAADIATNTGSISTNATNISINTTNIATNAANIPTNNNQLTNGAGYTTNVGTVTEVTVGTALGVTNGTTTPNITLDTANLYKVIGTATDHSSRVTLDGGVAEGATSIMKNLETIIFN